jgi:hypothetical protein
MQFKNTEEVEDPGCRFVKLYNRKVLFLHEDEMSYPSFFFWVCI